MGAERVQRAGQAGRQPPADGVRPDVRPEPRQVCSGRRVQGERRDGARAALDQVRAVSFSKRPSPFELACSPSARELAGLLVHAESLFSAETHARQTGPFVHCCTCPLGGRGFVLTVKLHPIL